MKLFLIRHGESIANINKTYAGQTDVPLSAKGKEQAEGIRNILSQKRFDKVYCSDLSRAVETQRTALPGWEGVKTPLLREYDVGLLAGQKIDAVRNEYGEELNKAYMFASFGGEDFAMVRNRILSFMAELEKEPCANVAVFTHGGIMRSMLSVVLQAELDMTAVCCENCCISVFEYNNDQWSLQAWNVNGAL